MFAPSRQFGRGTLSRCRFLKPRDKISITDESSKCLSAWKGCTEGTEADSRIGTRVPRRWNSSRISEGLSHYYHPGKVPLMDINAGKLLERAVDEWPNRECIVSLHQGVRLTFSEALRRADKFAAGLLKLGLKKGDCIGLWGPNDVEWFISFLAFTRAGFIMVGINPAYRQSEIDYCLKKIGARAVVAPRHYKTQNYPSMLLSAKEKCPSLQHIIIYSEDHVSGTRRWSDVESLANNSEVQAISAMQNDISPYDGCNIQFTSGTTGVPKATLLSHRSFVNNSRQTAERTGLVEGYHKICLNVPFFHAFAMVMAQFSCLHAGATIVLESQSFNPKHSVEAIMREKCTVAYGTPTMWINLLDARERLRAPIDTIQIGVTGGATISPDVFRKIRERLRVDRMQSIYGLTEVTAVAFQSLPGESTELTYSTVGHVSDHIEVMVVDENESPVPFGSPGELWIRGYSTMMNYWDDEANTKKTINEDGWMKTGDQFCLRPDGYGSVVGRLKDMIIRGGENIFPKEIEHFLESHPAILEAHVFGVHDDVYGEEICACVRLNADAKVTKGALQSYAKGNIAHFKIPRYIEIVDNFPRTASGKIRKFELRDELVSRGIVPGKPEHIQSYPS